MNTNNDLYLVNKLASLKIPLWISLFPIIGDLVYIAIYRSWVFAYSDINIAWKNYRRTILRTSGIWFFTIFGFLMFSSIFLIIMFGISYEGNLITPFFVWGAFSIIIFNLIYQPIILFLEPKRIYKDFKIDQKLINSSFKENNAYSFKECLNIIKTNLFNISYFCIFTNSDEIKKRWISNANGLGYSLAKYNIVNKELNNKPSSYFGFGLSHFKYLFTTGIWFIGITYLIFKLFDKNHSFIKQIKITGILFTLFFYIINIAMIVLFVVIYFGNPSSIFLIFSPFIVLLVNLVYVNLIGLIISFKFKNDLKDIKE